MEPETFLNSAINYLDILRDLDEGVAITDAEGTIMFLNDAQVKIDGIAPETAIGRPLERSGRSPRRTASSGSASAPGVRSSTSTWPTASRAGRIANTINSIFPLRTADGLVGSISFVRGYNLMEETITSICSLVDSTRSHPNRNGTRFTFQDIIGESPVFLDSIRTAKMAALTPSRVMIHGDTGTGKELFAQSIHNYSPREGPDLHGLNCAAIPENLLEGLLFGTVREPSPGRRTKLGSSRRPMGDSVPGRSEFHGPWSPGQAAPRGAGEPGAPGRVRWKSARLM